MVQADHLVAGGFQPIGIPGTGTLQETNISHLGKKENHLQTCNLSGGYVSSLELVYFPTIGRTTLIV